MTTPTNLNKTITKVKIEHGQIWQELNFVWDLRARKVGELRVLRVGKLVNLF